MQYFLGDILTSLPSETPEHIVSRIREAIAYLITSSPPPRSAWCHMDLIQHFATMHQIPLWLPGQTPIQLTGWLGQMNRAVNNPTHTSQGMAYNGSDHFSIITPDITVAQRAEAHQVLERALNAEPLPPGWICIRGVKTGRQIGSGDDLDEITSQPDNWHPVNRTRGVRETSHTPARHTASAVAAPRKRRSALQTPSPDPIEDIIQRMGTPMRLTVDVAPLPSTSIEEGTFVEVMCLRER